MFPPYGEKGRLVSSRLQANDVSEERLHGLTFPNEPPMPGYDLPPDTASPWIRRFAPLIAGGGGVLDVACGNGRNGRHCLALGHRVVFLDINISGVADLVGNTDTECMSVDLEGGDPWPLDERQFAAVLVVNYLYRPLMARLFAALAPGGLLFYETFSRAQTITGRPPRNPDHLLAPGELLRLIDGILTPIAFEEGLLQEDPFPGIKQRLLAVNDLGPLAATLPLPRG